MRLIWYSLLRLMFLAAAVGVGYVLGLRGWLLFVMGVFLAAAASYLLLRGPRDAAARQLAAGIGRRRARPTIDVDAEHEDALDDAARRLAREIHLDDRGRAGALERQGHTEAEAVAELEEPGVPQDRDEIEPGRAAEHGAGESPDRDR
mgnify:CR=1 FL=1